MNFDGWDLHGGDGVANGHAGMRITTGIKNNGAMKPPGFLDLIDEDPFNVGLEKFNANFVGRGSLPNERLDVLKGLLAINLRLPFAQKIQVRSIQN